MLKNWKKNLLWLLTAVFLMLCACGQVEIVIGDGSGVTHSLSHASASGVYVARHIIEEA